MSHTLDHDYGAGMLTVTASTSGMPRRARNISAHSICDKVVEAAEAANSKAASYLPYNRVVREGETTYHTRREISINEVTTVIIDVTLIFPEAVDDIAYRGEKIEQAVMRAVSWILQTLRPD